MSAQPISNRIFRICTPARIIMIITLLVAFQLIQIPWEYAIMIFYAFFPIFVASFVIEVILHPDGFRIGFGLLFFKYIQTLPMEFLVVATFALSSFFPQSNDVHEFELKIALLLLGIGITIELFHHYVLPRLRTRRLSDVEGILVVIGVVVALVFVSFRAFFMVIQYVI